MVRTWVSTSNKKKNRFEKNNSNITENVLFKNGKHIDSKKSICTHESELNRNCSEQVNLLMIPNWENRHYTTIKNISRLLSKLNGRNKACILLSHELSQLFSFNCYLTAQRPNLDHCQGGSLINPMFITVFFLLISTRKLPRASQRGWVPKPSQAPEGVWTGNHLNLNVMLWPTRPLSPYYD